MEKNRTGDNGYAPGAKNITGAAGEGGVQSFIETQQELAREKATIKENPIEDNGELIDGSYAYFYLPDLDTLITQIITNTGEELLRRAEGERYVTSAEEHERRRDHATKGGYEKAIDTMRQHITNLTGVE